MLIKFYRILCVLLALVMTVEAPAQIRAQLAFDVQTYFTKTIKLNQLKTVGDVLAATQSTLPKEMSDKFAVYLQGHAKQKLPRLTLVENKLMLEDNGKVVTVEFRDIQNNQIFVNGERILLSDLQAVTPAVNKIANLMNKKTAHYDYFIEKMFLQKAEAAFPFLIIGGLAAIMAAAFAWSKIGPTIARGGSSRSSSDKTSDQAARRDKRDEEDRKLEEKRLAAAGRVADEKDNDTNRCTPFPHAAGACSPTAAMIAYQMTYEDSRAFFCGKGEPLLKNDADRNNIDAVVSKKAEEFHSQRSQQFSAFLASSGLTSQANANKAQQIKNLKSCLTIVANNEKTGCNPMQKMKATYAPAGTGTVSIYHCTAVVPEKSSPNRTVAQNEVGATYRSYGSLSFPIDPCEVYPASEKSCSGAAPAASPASPKNKGRN